MEPLYVIGALFLLVLAVLWFFLPFAIFGMQPKMQKILDEAKQTNHLLVEIKGLLQIAAAPECKACGKPFNPTAAVCPHCGCAR
ncbi:MAG: hypothetical protein NUV75_01770 [Gallionella sp.]|nr:hypothetical protein [Gallionella sp.]